MKIALTYDNGNVFQHFGHTEEFKIYDIEDGKINSSEVVPTNGSGHGALAGFLKDLGASTLICGGIGGGAQLALSEAKIELYAGITGSCDEAVAAFIAGTLVHNTEANCNHHHEHSEGRNCGGHCHE